VSTIETETAILESILSRLRADGYDVFRKPPPHVLPEFMADYRPDAIAIGRGKKLAIEIVGDQSRSPAMLSKLQERFTPDSGWELQVVYARSQPSIQSMETVPETSIERSLATVGQLNEAGLTQPALLIAWASFEALGRRLLPDHFERPQTPGRLVEILAREGHLTPDEADAVRQLIATRNRLIHGDLDVQIDKAQVEHFTSMLAALLTIAKEDGANR
jgi:uncharacterized protein YutE (UPF0331/DUF86 family)